MRHMLVVYTNIILLYLILGIAIITDTTWLMFLLVIPMIFIYFYNKEHRCITE